jgi:hypothetical protein
MDLAYWQPYTPSQLRTVLAGATFPYWLAGGYAIEQFVGEAYRAHDDIDIIVRRSDQAALRHALPTYHFYAADPPGTLRPWRQDEFLPHPIHDVWIKAEAEGAFVFQVMFMDTEDGMWLYRRDPRRLREPLADFGIATDSGDLMIRPEIQLLYKAKTVRPKDALDFQRALPKLAPPQKQWLKAKLQQFHPDHVWLEQL